MTASADVSCSRRRFLSGAAAALGTGLACPGSLVAAIGPGTPPRLPRVNDGINVQPIRRLDEVSDFTPPLIRPEIVAAQLRAVYELGFRSLRITASFNQFGPDFFAAIPYVRAARALGVDVVLILEQFGFGYDLLRALSDPGRRRAVLEAYVDLFAAPVAGAGGPRRSTGSLSVQVLNEPTHFRGIAPADYVHHFLAPVREELLRIAPSILVLSAAPVGRTIGVVRLRELLEAGVESLCDLVAVHVYDRSIAAELAAMLRGPVTVTETGARGAGSQLDWVREVHPELRRLLPDLRGIHHFVLMDHDPEGFRVLGIEESADGGVRVEVTSPELYEHWRARVREAAGQRPHAAFEELLPSLAPYMPTEEDFRRVAGI